MSLVSKERAKKALWFALPLGAASFAKEWARLGKDFVYIGHTNSLQDIWWRFPLKVGVFLVLLLLRLPQSSDSETEHRLDR